MINVSGDYNISLSMFNTMHSEETGAHCLYLVHGPGVTPIVQVYVPQKNTQNLLFT